MFETNLAVVKKKKKNVDDRKKAWRLGAAATVRFFFNHVLAETHMKRVFALF